jgi:hypothetical protein
MLLVLIKATSICTKFPPLIQRSIAPATEKPAVEGVLSQIVLLIMILSISLVGHKVR